VAHRAVLAAGEDLRPGLRAAHWPAWGVVLEVVHAAHHTRQPAMIVEAVRCGSLAS